MPELPEVETMRRGLAGAVKATIIGAYWPRCRLRPIQVTPTRQAFSRRVRGRVVTAIERLGKRVVACLDSQHRIVFEPRMTGLVLVGDPPDEEHQRLRLDLEGTRVNCIRFWDRRGLGTISLLTPEEVELRWGPHSLGPDALCITADELQARLGTSRRAIKVPLLDQAVLAGIGNLYASEILHAARIHPETPCRRLAARRWRRLQTAMVEVLEEAIRCEGSTLSDGTYRNALNSPGSYQNYHRVYDRAGHRCLSCHRTTVRRIVQAQRSTFFCPICQRR